MKLQAWKYTSREKASKGVVETGIDRNSSHSRRCMGVKNQTSDLKWTRALLNKVS